MKSNLTKKNLRGKTSEAIQELVDFFEKNPEIFKSESDIKCYLFHLLIKKIPNKIKTLFDNDKYYYEFLVSTEQNTRKKHKSKNNGLRYPKKFDITILDPKNTEKSLIGIELKFNIHKGLQKTSKNSIYKDLRKVNIAANKLEEGHVILLNSYEPTKKERKLLQELKDHFFNKSKKTAKNCDSNLWIRHYCYESGELIKE